MASHSVVSNMNLSPRSALRNLRLRGLNAKTAGAVLGICGGIIAPVFGSVLTAISWVTGATWHGIHVQRDGTVLFFLTIPLLIIGAECLDLLDRQDDSRRPEVSTFNNGRTKGKGNGNDLGRDKEGS